MANSSLDSSLDISGVLGIQMPGLGKQNEQFKFGDFDLDAHSSGVAWSCLFLASIVFILWCAESVAGKWWNLDCGGKSGWSLQLSIFLSKTYHSLTCADPKNREEPSARIKRQTNDGIKLKENLGNAGTFLWKVIFCGALFMWAWSSAKTILGHQTAMHIFGGLALGLGLAMRDFFSNALIYFVLRINAPFSKNDLLAVRPRYGELYIGQVVGMDFLHTKLATLTDAGNQVGESFQFVQNKLLMSNTLAVFGVPNSEAAPRSEAWDKYKSWRIEQFQLAHPTANMHSHRGDDAETSLENGNPQQYTALRHRGSAHLIYGGVVSPGGDHGLKF